MYWHKFVSIYAAKISVRPFDVNSLNQTHLNLTSLLFSNEPKMNSVRCLPLSPQRWAWGLKTQNGLFPSEITLYLMKLCYKVSLCEYCQQQSCKAFIVLSIRAKNRWWGQILPRDSLAETDPPPSKRRFPINIHARSASALIPSENFQLTRIGSPL